MSAGNTDTGGLGQGNVSSGGRVIPPAETSGGRVIADGASPGASPQLRELHFDPGGRRFWAFGSKGAIAVAAEIGAPWRTRILDPTVDVADLHFAADGLAGWAVGSRGALFATEDGGETWTRRASGTSADLASVHSTRNGEKVWAAGADGTLVASSDKGASWRALSSGAGAVLRDVEISFDGRQAWAVGGRGLILSSNDGGATWRQRKSGTRQPLRAVAFDFTGAYGIAVGDGGTVLVSEDAGASWEPSGRAELGDLTDVWLSSTGARAWIVRDSAGLLQRVDKGVWTPQFGSALDRISPLRIASNGRLGLAVGANGAAATRDSGNSWTLLVETLVSRRLSAADIADSGASLIVGEGGHIFIAGAGNSEDWTPATSDTDASLNTVHIVDSGRTAWAAGDGGILLASSDQGRTWEARDGGTGAARLGIRFSRDGAVGLAVGHEPSLLRTVDGGATWTSARLPLRHRRYPAPWFWLALPLCCLPLVLPLRTGDSGPGEEGAAAIGASDRPTQDFAHDRLQFGPLAMGISRFLRNSRTEPPLTVAISGNWGSGKSSLMQLVCTDLRRHGYRPVWFNAWHHQSDEQLLASLLNAVREQGLPSLASVDGWVFRFQLLWLRSKKNYALALVAVAVAAAIATTWISGDIDAASWTRIATSIGDLFGNDNAARGADVKDAVAPASVLGAFAALFAAYRATRAFGLDPAVLLSSSFNSFRLKDASAQTSFRDRFAEEFGDVTEVLPYRVVIVIDDLDRCRPETVLTVMESVNFLVSAGPCFILFGMARERVLAGLSLTFHSIAKELTELDVALPADATEAQRERAERDARARYASDYLEKLINIDIKVPAREDIPPHVLLEAAAEPRAEGPVGILRRLWPVLLVLAAAGLGVAAPAWLGGPEGPAPVAIEEKAQPRPAPAEQPAAPAPAAREPQAGPAPAIAPAAPIRAPLQTAAVQPGAEAAAWWYLVAGLAVFALILAAVLRYQSRREHREVRDSQAFLAALETWLPVVQKRRPSPRRIKRFGNFIRYLAMLQQGDPPPERPMMPLLRRLRIPSGDPGADPIESTPPATKLVVEEHRLVALAALYDAYESKWRENLIPPGNGPLDDAVRAAILKVMRESSWPPSPEELASFDEAIKGVRLAGTAEIVHAGPSSAEQVDPDSGATPDPGLAEAFDTLFAKSRRPTPPPVGERPSRARTKEGRQPPREPEDEAQQ